MASRTFVATSLWELLFLYYVLYYFSYQIRLFPWFFYMPDRWGEIIFLILLWILFFAFCIPVLFQIASKQKKKRFRNLAILIFIALFSFLFYDTFFAYFGYFTISIIAIYKTTELVKNTKTLLKKPKP